MHAPTILAVVSAAGLAAAAPVESTWYTPEVFDVSQFTFGFSDKVGYYDGLFSVPGFAGTVKCSGPSNVDHFQPCKAPTNDISTYVIKNPTSGEYELHAQWRDSTSYYHTGKTTVYAETGPERAKARSDFTIPFDA